MPSVLLLFLTLSHTLGHGKTVYIDAEPTFVGISLAVARTRSAVNDGSSVIVSLPSGVHTINMTDALFDVTGLQAPFGGKVIFAGQGMDQTRLVLTTQGHNVIQGLHGWRGLVWSDLTFDRAGRSTTQAFVVAATNATLDLSIEPGYPGIQDLLVERLPRIKAEQGLFLRRFRAGKNTCEIVTDAKNGSDWPPTANAQVHFTCGGDGENCPDIVETASGHYRLHVSWPDGELQLYQKAIHLRERVAVKVKHDGQAYYLSKGSDISFVRVRWLQHSRGIILNTPNVHFRDTRVDRQVTPVGSELEPCLATPGGGPQVNGESVGGVHNVTFSNHTSAGTGDDSIALFGILSGSVRACTISDSFARGINLQNSPNVDVSKGNSVKRCPIVHTDGLVYV